MGRAGGGQRRDGGAGVILPDLDLDALRIFYTCVIETLLEADHDLNDRELDALIDSLFRIDGLDRLRDGW